MENLNIEKKGEDVVLTINLIRHAEKSSIQGGLSEKGKNDSAALGEMQNLKIYHSGISRTRETAENMTSPNYIPRERSDLTVQDKVSEDFLKSYIEEVKSLKGSECLAVNKFLKSGKDNFDKSTISSAEISGMLAVSLLHFVKLTKYLKEKSRPNIALISHTGVIEHLLVDLFNVDRQDPLGVLGGSLNFLEGVTVTIKRQNIKSPCIISVSFRGITMEVSEDRLVEISKQFEVGRLSEYGINAK